MEIKKNILVLFVITLFFSCESLIGDIDESEDSGYELIIINFTENNYRGFTLYSGAIDSNNKFIPLDSLVYNNIIIPNRDFGGNVTQNEKKTSIFRPFDAGHPKLTKFNTWAPPSFERINQISSENKVSLKFLLHETQQSILKTQNGVGTFHIEILEDGSFR